MEKREMFTRIAVFLFLIMSSGLWFAGSSGAIDTDLPWTVEYTGDLFPHASSPRWTKVEADNNSGPLENPYLNHMKYTAVETITTGNLNIKVSATNVSGGTDCFTCHRPSPYTLLETANIWPVSYTITDGSLSNAAGTTVEARIWKASTLSNSLGLELSDGTFSVRLRIDSGAIYLRGVSESPTPQLFKDTTDGYHIYRITLIGNAVFVYFDGVQVLQGTASNASTSKTIKFGHYTGHSLDTDPIESDWDYVRYWTGGVSAVGDAVADDDGDNCPNVFNPRADWTDKNGVTHTATQPDFDLDTIGDACDPDADGDGYQLDGLLATYSTGVGSTLEGPIFHGYGILGSCGVAVGNMYEGICVPVTSSPVDWAWGSFSVTWDGELYVPVSGSYLFNSNYWVDGTGSISVDGTPVANFDTSGGDYMSKTPPLDPPIAPVTLSLTGGTWVPISMTFTSNGGSNNIHLAWTPPGGMWQVVPREYLAAPGFTDPDDLDPTVFPGAPEICDGKDNNGDGQIDEGVLITYYKDADGDGFGDPNVTIQACAMPSGYQVNNLDCNDSDPLVHPGAAEVWYNGKDDDCNPATLDNDPQRDALVDLYNSTNGAGWTNKTNWLGAPGTECGWFGITCDGLNNVIRIILSFNNLSGPIPDSLGSLGNLRDLWLNENLLSGPIPASLGGLSNLQEISLSSNQLTGTIPSWLASLSNLQLLRLSMNQLDGPIPSFLGSLSGLQELQLYGNQLTGPIPAEIGNLNNLNLLSLAWNHLSGPIPAELGNLTNIHSLYLDRNDLTDPIPASFGNLTNLRILFLSNNQLTGSIPASLGSLSNLQELRLNNNQLTGSIPPELGSLTNLRLLHLASNQLTGSIPPQLGDLSSLRELYLYENWLTDIIPAELGNLSNLGYLHLYSNQLTGSIPPELGDLTSLRYLYLFSNQLTGSIPLELGDLTSLQYLYLNSNQLTGSIPPELGNLSNLQYLVLSSNQLTGSIPPALGNLSNLLFLGLSSNQLTGAIPIELGNLINLVNGNSNFRWNALYTSDSALRTFLNSKQVGGGWESTQTIAPTNLSTGAPTENSVTLTWTPIAYTGNEGGYDVFYSQAQDGPYTLYGTTTDKSASLMPVTGLTPNTTYYFRVQTQTATHANNQNTVISGYSSVVSATTIALAVNGMCGSSNGGTFTTAPNSGLCLSGDATAVSGDGPWSWSCTGLNGGATDNCSANICKDMDNDGYSPDGGACGPLDCFDSDPNITPTTIWYKDEDGDFYTDGTTFVMWDGTTFHGCTIPWPHKLAGELFSMKIDNCPSVFNPAQLDNDGDGIGDVCDDDDDSDGVPDVSDICPFVFNPLQEDTDSDGVGNSCDNCPFDPNQGQQDSDNNGVGDVCQDVAPPVQTETASASATLPDTDRDTIADVYDNCPSVRNGPSQAATAGVGNQTDTDGDGIGNACDNCPTFMNPNQVIPSWYKDADNDGYSDGTRVTQCFQPAGYNLGENLTAVIGDCNDADINVNPGATEVSNNDKDDDCNSITPDRPRPYDISFTPSVNVNSWLPTDGAVVTVTAVVKTSSGATINTPITFSVISVTTYPGKYTNDASTDTSEDFTYAFSGNTATLTSLDYGGSIILRAEATVIDGATYLVQKDYVFPPDRNGNGLPDAWEDRYGGNLTANADIDRSPNNAYVGDGLSNFNEYRGFKWGGIERVLAGGSYKTNAWIPTGTVSHFRTSPNRKDLFVKYRGYDATTMPFAIGDALYNAEIDVHAVDYDTATLDNLGQNRIDPLVVTNETSLTYSGGAGNIFRRSARDWSWDTKGASGQGTATAYGLSTKTYARALTNYFSDKPYIDSSVGSMGVLDPLLSASVEDRNDNALQDRGEDANNNNLLDGDLYDPNFGTSQRNLSPFDINNDGLVELPVAGNPLSVNTSYQYTLAQVLKHTITHEMTHAIGAVHNPVVNCLMYQYSTNWSRDWNLSSTAKGQLLIHNQ